MTQKISSHALAIAAMIGATSMAAFAAPVSAPVAGPAAGPAADMPPMPPAVPVQPVKPPVKLIAPPGVAATVNGVTITTAQVDAMAIKMAGDNAVNQLIDQTLIDQAAAKQHLVVSDADVQAEIDKLAAEVAPKTLAQAIVEHHTTLDELKDQIKLNLERTKLSSVGITAPRMLHVREILIATIAIPSRMPGAPGAPTAKPHTPDEALAIIKTIQAQLKAGKSFEDLEKIYNEDPGTKPKGGDLGMVYEGAPIDPNFVAAVLPLKRGQITPTPAKSYAGYHLVQVIDTTEDHPASDNALFATAEQNYITQHAQGNAQHYIQTLKDSGNVVNYMAQ